MWLLGLSYTLIHKYYNWATTQKHTILISHPSIRQFQDIPSTKIYCNNIFISNYFWILMHYAFFDQYCCKFASIMIVNIGNFYRSAWIIGMFAFECQYRHFIKLQTTSCITLWIPCTRYNVWISYMCHNFWYYHSWYLTDNKYKDLF